MQSSALLRRAFWQRPLLEGIPALVKQKWKSEMKTYYNIHAAFDAMEIKANTRGDFPLAVHLPAKFLPTAMTGTIEEVEVNVQRARAELQQAYAAADKVMASRTFLKVSKVSKVSKVEEDANVATAKWITTELIFAGLLRKHRVPLAGRSMIVLAR